MKNILTHIFVTLGVIFLLLIIAGIGFVIADPYNLKPLIFGSEHVQQPSATTKNTDSQNTTQTDTTTIQGGFTLSEAQKQALISFGVDPAVVPTTLSAAEEECFVSVLGVSRVAEIKAGAVPSALEFLKGKSCI